MSDLKNPWLALATASIIALIAFFFLLPIGSIFAHDHENPDLDEWYAALKMPDAPTVSCCGKADAYWCDDYYSRDGKAYCKIEDDRDIPDRPKIANGTEILIPPYKLKWDRGNPTGHAVVFMSSMGFVFCYVQNGGV